MSLFRTLAETARQAHQHFFGGSVTLAEPGTTPRTVNVVLGREIVETRREDNRDVRYLVRECRFVDLTTLRSDAIVTIGTITYAIDHIEDRQASGITAKLQRTTVVDANRPGYRGKG